MRSVRDQHMTRSALFSLSLWERVRVRGFCRAQGPSPLPARALLLADILIPDVWIRRNVLSQERDARGVMEIVDGDAMVA